MQRAGNAGANCAQDLLDAVAVVVEQPHRRSCVRQLAAHDQPHAVAPPGLGKLAAQRNELNEAWLCATLLAASLLRWSQLMLLDGCWRS